MGRCRSRSESIHARTRTISVRVESALALQCQMESGLFAASERPATRTPGAREYEQKRVDGSLRDPFPVTGCVAAAGQLTWQRVCAGVPNGIRTRVGAVKGRCPRPLDDGDGMVRRACGLGGTRTHDQRLKRPLLYRLSYEPVTSTNETLEARSKGGGRYHATCGTGETRGLLPLILGRASSRGR
jgi:hypothetical protein